MKPKNITIGTLLALDAGLTTQLPLNAPAAVALTLTVITAVARRAALRLA